MPLLNESEWDSFLSHYPNAHILQTSAWGKLKSEFGWQVARLAIGPGREGIGAQMLLRRLPFGLNLAYIARGPVGASCTPGAGRWDELWPEVDDYCRQRRVIFLKVEPDLWEATQDQDCTGLNPGAFPRGFRLSKHAIQPQRTLVVNLAGEEDRVLARMKQKTRYNIRLALKRGVVVHPGADLEAFYRLMEITGGRNEFGVHSRAYYQRVYELFYPAHCQLLVAEYQGDPLAAIMVFARGRRAWYFYGASSDQHREKMPTYLLQWEAMRWARSRGCTDYDLWGVPDVDEQTLEENFLKQRGGLWGVYRFKRGFGGDLRRSIGPWDRVYQPALYTLYRFLFGRGVARRA